MPPRLVVPEGLTALATQMRQFPWHDADFNAATPDGLPSSADAISNLNESARTLVEYQKLAQAENTRMAERFESTAKAYAEVDRASKDALDGAGRQAAIDNIPVSAPSTELPPIPDGPAAPKGLDASGYSDVEETHALFESGDKGASLTNMKANAEVAGDFVMAHAWAQTPTDWEGDAAQAAFRRLNSFNEWLGELSAAWKRLGDAAEKIKTAHDAAYTQHMGVWVQYMAVKAQLEALMASAGHVGGSVASQVAIQQAFAEMEKLQHESDELRQNYAHSSTFDPVRVAQPPFGSGSGPANANAPGGTGTGAGGGAGGGGGAGATSTPGMPPRAPSPMSAEQAAGKSPAGEGSGSGGGSPAGGGAPSGGSPGGGMPSLPGGGPGDTPLLPDDPSLHPASAGGGAGGGSGGGAGGGAGSIPLQPSVGGVSVGPGPAGAGGGGGTPAAAGGAGGMMGGGMGGGMGGAHGGQAQGGKEKRRTPGLSPDEELYVEDREYTEEVIGDRKRRTVQDPKDSK